MRHWPIGGWWRIHAVLAPTFSEDGFQRVLRQLSLAARFFVANRLAASYSLDMDRGPYAAQPETMASCARCAALIERRTAAYSQHGEPLCSDCAMRDEIAVNEAGSAVYMKGVAYGSLALAVFGLVYNPFHLMSFVLVLNGVLLARQLIGEAAWYRRRLGWHYWPALISVFVSATVGGLLVLMPLAAVSLAIYGG